MTATYISGNNSSKLKINYIKVLHSLYIESIVKVSSINMKYVHDCKELAIESREFRGLTNIELK